MLAGLLRDSDEFSVGVLLERADQELAVDLDRFRFEDAIDDM